MASSYKKALVYVENKTAELKGSVKAKLHKVPPYTVTYTETYGSGGWIEGKRTVTETVNDTFLIIKDDVCIGVVFEPYASHLRIKTDIFPIGVYPKRHLPGKSNIENEIKKFCNEI